MVDDGSSDRTREMAEEAGARVVSHAVNSGVGAAMATGVEYALRAGADLAVNIDADGQFDAQEIVKVIQPVLAGKADMVVGDRFADGQPENMPSVKYQGNRMMNWFVSRLAGRKFSDVSCGFRAYSREALLNLNLFGKFTYTQETFLDMQFKGLRVIQIPVSVKYFDGRKSRVAGNLFSYAWKTLVIIIRSMAYYKPLRFFAYPGIVLLFVGFLFIAFLIWFRLATGGYSPYKSFGFIGGGLSLFGLLLVFMGLVTDILDRIRQNQEKLLYFEKKRRYLE